MKMFLQHLGARLRAAVAEPGSLFLLAAAGLSTLLLWPWMLAPGVLEEEAVVFASILLTLLFVWPMLVVFGATGSVSTVGSRMVVGATAMPALPIGTHSRRIAELLAALLVIVGFRFLGGEAAGWAFGVRELRPDGGGDFTTFLAATAWGLLVTLPGIISWTGRRWIGARDMIVPLAICGLTFLVLRSSLWEMPFGRGFALAALILVAWFSPRLETTWEGHFRPRAGRRINLQRPGLAPDRRLRRDFWFAPLRRWGWVVALYLGYAVAVPVLDSFYLLPEYTKDLAYGTIYGLSMSVFGIFALFPLGLEVFKTERYSGSGGLLGGNFGAAWAVLPVRRESLARVIYAHTLLAGLAWVVFLAGFTLTVGRLGLQGSGPLRFFLPFGMAIPPLAGFMTCTTVGDRLRGWISLSALILVLPSRIAIEVICSRVGLARDSAAALAVGLGALAVLAIAGGLPPLVHLRRDRPEDGGLPTEAHP